MQKSAQKIPLVSMFDQAGRLVAVPLINPPQHPCPTLTGVSRVPFLSLKDFVFKLVAHFRELELGIAIVHSDRRY
jgi:hypothetical protein